MTIVFQGHIKKVELGIAGKVEVTIDAELDICPHPIVLKIPQSQACHWLTGQQVSFTVYALPAPAQAPA